MSIGLRMHVLQDDSKRRILETFLCSKCLNFTNLIQSRLSFILANAKDLRFFFVYPSLSCKRRLNQVLNLDLLT